MKLTIDRSKWMRGLGPGTGRLLDEETGKRCCVGIFLSARGMLDEDLRNLATADCLRMEQLPEETRFLVDLGTDYFPDRSDDAEELYQENDVVGDDAPREARVKEIFARHGVEVEFVGGEP